MRFFKKYQKFVVYLAAFLVILSLFFVDDGVKAVKEMFSSKPAAGDSVKESVRFYNLALEKVFEKNRLSYLDNYASDEEKERIKLYAFQLINNQKIQMRIKLFNINFKEIKKFKKNKAEVRTDELWENSYFKADNPSVEASPKEKIAYQTKYTLIKQNNNWLVSKVDVLKEKKSD